MDKLILDGEKIKDRQILHDILAEGLQLPEWYGRNLDALHDCLNDFAERPEIEILNRDALEKNLGHYAVALEKMLRVQR